MMPPLVAVLRLVLGAAALVFSLDGVNLFLAATLIVATVVIGGLGQWIGARDAVTGAPAVRFDDVTDYLTLIVGPWLLMQSMLVGSRSLLQEVLLDLPLAAGAIRCTGGTLAPAGAAAARGRRGLSALFFAFVAVTAVFLHLPALMDPARLTRILAAAAGVLSLLMLAPVRYPAIRGWASAIVLVFVAAMPFVASEIMAATAILGGIIYIVAAPFVPRSPGQA